MHKNVALESIRDEVGYHAAWARWSSTYDEVTELADQIGRQPASTVGDLAVKLDVLVWLLLADDEVVDQVAARQVRLFARELRQMASPRRLAKK